MAPSASFYPALGFFVRRMPSDPSAYGSALLSSCGRLEVSHVRSTFKGGERGVSWLFHTIGSGVFIDCRSLPTEGRRVAYRDRLDFARVERTTWQNDEGFPREWMRRNHVAMLVFAQADFHRYGFRQGANPRTEIIILHKTDWSTEVGDPSGPCLDGASIGIQTFSGWKGTRPCRCRRESRFLNCDVRSESGRGTRTV